MPYSPLDLVPADVRQRAERVRMACFDVDGTLTDGRLYFDSDGSELKAFSVLDGLGLSLLRRRGFEVALITARMSLVAERRGAELGVAVHVGVKDKLACLGELCRRQRLELDQVAYMGDDLPDLSCLGAVGLAVAPADAHPWIAERVHWRTRALGGRGAARELCDVLLAAQGHVPAILREHGA